MDVAYKFNSLKENIKKWKKKNGIVMLSLHGRAQEVESL